MRGKRVTLHHLLDGALRVRYKDKIVACTPFRTLPSPAPAEDEKTLDARIDAVIAAKAAHINAPQPSRLQGRR